MKPGSRITRLGAVLIAGSIALGASGAALAQDGRLYFGGSFGQAEANDLCSDLDALVTGLGDTLQGCDEKDSAFKIFGGFQVNPNFAIEASYFDYGKFKANGDSGGSPFTISADATAFGIAAVGILPVGQRFSVFGKVGFLSTELDVLAAGPGGAFSESDSETGLHIGLGALFSVTDRIGIRAEWERNDELEVDMISVGVQVRF
jgi:OOP family OmpA-OmpF porin